MNATVEPEFPNEESKNVEAPSQENSAEETTLSEQPTANLDELISKMKAFLSESELSPRNAIEKVRHLFNQAVLAEKERAYAEAETEEERNDIARLRLPQEDDFQRIYVELKNRRAEELARLEAEKEANLKRRQEIIDEIRQIADEASEEDFGKHFTEFKLLQKEWNNLKTNAISSENDLWRAYQRESERIYDLVRMNHEMRDYDFKKNLEQKNAIIEAAQRLENEPDKVSAFHQLQNFHAQWREIGPVAKEIREELWAKFKEISSSINRKHQQHFEQLKAKEVDNLAKKTEICERIEAIDVDAIASHKDWEAKSQEIIDLQAKWKTIGFAPKASNTAIFERFRKACDHFFERKSAHFKSVRNEFSENLEKKTALCEKAEALKESTEWKKTAEQLSALQKEWRTIGAVSRKHSDALWNRFRGACDHFFEQRKKNLSGQSNEEVANLAKKKHIIAEIEAISPEISTEEAYMRLKELLAEWNEIGHVPFREKDKVNARLHKAADAQFDRLRIDKSERRVEAFRSSMENIAGSEGAKSKLLQERRNLVHRFERIKSDIQTYENNIGFLSVSSKKGNGLLKEMEQKIESLRGELDVIARQVDAVDDAIRMSEKH